MFLKIHYPFLIIGSFTVLAIVVCTIGYFSTIEAQSQTIDDFNTDKTLSAELSPIRTPEVFPDPETIPKLESRKLSKQAIVSEPKSNLKKTIEDSDDLQEEKTQKTITKESIIGSKLSQSCECLIEAYPDFIKKVEKNRVVWFDGSDMEFDDGKVKTHNERLDNPDIEDQIFSFYPKGRTENLPDFDEDPGRVRNMPFFKKMYGSNVSEVAKNLDTVYWLKSTINHPLLVTRINGVNKKLQAISNELESKPKLLKYLDNPAGTFNWRVILNTDRLSAHSFGISIDINVKFSNYWAWDKEYKYKNQIPWAIIEVFEEHDFIWGGKWYHYDTMHFEYRPELFTCEQRNKVSASLIQ